MRPLTQDLVVGNMDTTIFDADRATSLQFFKGTCDNLAHSSQLRRQLFLRPVWTRLLSRQLTNQPRQSVSDLIESHLTYHSDKVAHHFPEICQHLVSKQWMRRDKCAQFLD